MAADPLIWILSRGRKGDLDQMLALAGATGWPHEVKRLRFRGPEIPVLSRLLLRNAAEVLTPPWPDLVLCAEALPSVIARKIRQQSQGRSRIACLGRPAGMAADFDLLITTAQYRVPAAPHVVELSMPLTGAAEPATGGSSGGPIALLVGGPAFPDLLDAGTARRLIADATALAQQRGRMLRVITSPRTPREVNQALRETVRAPHALHVFGEGGNRYRAALAEASEIIVTSDSVSMTADALAAGKPAAIYPLPQARDLKWRLGEWLYRHAVETPSALLMPVRRLFELGLIEVAADRQRLFSRLVAEGRAAWFGEAPATPHPGTAREDMDRAVHALRALMKR